MSSLPRKNSEFLEMYRQDIENILLPYGFEYEDRDEYYESADWSAKKIKENTFLFFKIFPYGKVYLKISSTGRLSKFTIYAFYDPAIVEVANIEKRVYAQQAIKSGTNQLQWQEGVDGISLDLVSSTHVMRDSEIYQKTLNDIKNNLDTYISLTTPRQLFEYYRMRPNFHDFDFSFPERTRLGYWLIMAKLAGDDYYAELADEYVAINQERIQKEYNADITKLKEFLDTYVVGTLA